MPDINVLIKPSSGLCNLRCEYCFYRDEAKKREEESYGYMKEETLEQIIRKSIELSEHSCTIGYQGGEPTLRGLNFFKKSIEFQNKYNKRNIKIYNTMQTNGVGLSKEFIQFLKKNQFLVGISLDGIEYTHNAYRTFSDGTVTFKKVMETIQQFDDIGVDYNILTVVHSTTAKHISSIYEFYKKSNFKYLQFIPCLNPLGEEKIKYPFSLSVTDFGSFLKTLFDQWYDDIKRGEYVYIQQFENYMRLLAGLPPNICGMSGVCSYQHVVEADGEVYPCDFYVVDEYKLGNLNEVSFQKINEKRKELHFIEESVNNNSDCLTCKYGAICGGGCKRYRGSTQKNYFCEAYYEFFEYCLPRIKELVRFLKATV